jgi:hypothetical protein
MAMYHTPNKISEFSTDNRHDKLDYERMNCRYDTGVFAGANVVTLKITERAGHFSVFSLDGCAIGDIIKK